MNKIHEMLNNIDEDKYLDDEEMLSKEEENRIFELTMKKINDETSAIEEADRKPKNISFKKIVTFILVATLMISSISFAADYFDFNVRFKNLLSIDKDSQNLVNNSGMNINKSVKHKGIEIKATQAIGDKNSVYILFELTSEEKLDKDNYFFEDIDYSIYSKKFGYTGCTGTFQRLDTDNSDENKVEFLCSMESENINDKDVKFVFDGFGYYEDDAKENFVKLIDETWTLKFKLDYKNTSKTYVIGKTYRVDNKNIRVKTVEISPLSARIKISGKYQKFVSKITMKDGTVYEGEDFFINNSASYSTIGRDLFGKSESYTGFSKVLNVNDIKSITIDDEVEIELP